MTVNISELESKMSGALDALKREFSGLRTGRASTSLLDKVMVDAYGSMMPLNQVGSVSVPEPRMLSVQVWDSGLISSVEKAIRDSGLGLNPNTEGQLIRLPLPELTEERRKELAKIAKKYAEDARIAVRNIRRQGMDLAKKSEKDGDISQDELKGVESNVQNITDKFVSKIDDALAAKEQDIFQI